MKSKPGKVDVIYDGQCRFCRVCVSLFCRVDWLKRFHWIDGSDWKQIQKQFSELSSFESAEGLCVIDGGQVFWGFFSVRRMLYYVPILWPTLVIFYAPGMSILGPKLYGWIAKNRYRIGCNKTDCGDSMR